jgi:hypothetical protein
MMWLVLLGHVMVDSGLCLLWSGLFWFCLFWVGIPVVLGSKSLPTGYLLPTGLRHLGLHLVAHQAVIDPPLTWLHSLAEFTLTIHQSTSISHIIRQSKIRPSPGRTPSQNLPKQSIIQPPSAPCLAALPRRIYLNNPSFNPHTAK